MVLNQLFINKPSLELINKIVSKFGLKDIKDNTEFSILEMNHLNTLSAIKPFENEIRDCYIPCKREKYASIIDQKTIITILRQFLKVYDYDLYSKEKFIKGIKYTFYKIITKKEKDFVKNNGRKAPKKEITIVFD